MTDKKRLLYRITEAAEVLGVSRAQGYDWAARRIIPVVILDGIQRVPADQLEALVERLAQQSAADEVAPGKLVQPAANEVAPAKHRRG